MKTPDWLVRTELQTGKEGIDKLLASHVLVIGLGGVGAAAAEMICRAGVGQMTIADGDLISESNRNRQIPALTSTVGKEKAKVMGDRLLDINPQLKLKIISQYLKDEPMESLLKGRFDYVVDAIDTLSPKIYLIYHAIKNNQKVVSSMGSGGRFDPTLVTIADISETHHCQFAYDIRKRLRHLGIHGGVKAIFSPEKVSKDTILHCEEIQNKKSIVGTISYMPTVFGCACASVVIRDLIRN